LHCFAIIVLQVVEQKPVADPTLLIKKVPGDHIELETPVPIPTTEVKQLKPMVLANTERVGSCQDFLFRRPHHS
jgi:hypothetical protein